MRKFLSHTLSYWLSDDTVEGHYARYANRTITAQALALDEGEVRWLAAQLDENLRPERREYVYDFFLDNCATRVRDAIDRTVRGALATSVAGQPGRATYRGHVERVLAGSPFFARGVSLLLSGFVDHPIARWLELGVRATVCSDNTLLSAVTASSEYALVRSLPGVGQSGLRLLLEYGRAARFRRRVR